MCGSQNTQYTCSISPHVCAFRKHASEVAKFLGGTNEHAVEVAKKHTNQVVEVLAQELLNSGGTYLLGDEFSAADILLVHCMTWAEQIGWGSQWTAVSDGDSKMEKLNEYLNTCRARPAYGLARSRL